MAQWVVNVVNEAEKAGDVQRAFALLVFVPDAPSADAARSDVAKQLGDMPEPNPGPWIITDVTDPSGRYPGGID
jgi:hypothetical protein